MKKLRFFYFIFISYGINIFVAGQSPILIENAYFPLIFPCPDNIVNIAVHANLVASVRNQEYNLSSICDMKKVPR